MAAQKASTQRPESLTGAAESGIVLTIEQAARKLGIGRTTMYALVMSGEVRSVTIGRLRRVPTRCLDEYVSGLLENAQTVIPAA
ncbi:helix-turn-helix domain-containing protein [Phytohabitans sp. ZYX-F-186]|uniref:Helix-turn-helix domain-containing protein n=1 Tax=Phytohabitans maris TaxID=3071409 RepID=A0ABU0ZIJ2_9ACTN|nr:helix-turn-helix domain-containing protein [Phytohabitans sp. ZYX-F-186]MDQ7906873.1 helix-turn-helix domain-containing protein [Phytohabitans sp. ZYX-F-186]